MYINLCIDKCQKRSKKENKTNNNKLLTTTVSENLCIYCKV